MPSDNQETSATPVQQHFYKMNQPAPDEISLVDLLLILVRRRWWLIGTVIVVMAGAVAFLLLSKPVYTSHATLQIGQIANLNGNAKSTPLISTASLVTKLRAHYHINDKTAGPIKPPKMKSVKAHNGDLVTFKAEGYSPKQAQSFLHDAVSNILQSQKSRFNHRLAANKSYLNDLQEKRKTLGKQVDTIRKKITNYSGSNNQVVSALTTEQSNFLQQINTYQTKIANAKQSISRPDSRPTELLVDPTLPKIPISPRKKMILGIGVFLALFLGLIMAFGSEIVSNAIRIIRQGSNA